jgi:hypothetical protein
LKEEAMKARILVVLFAVLSAAGSLSFAAHPKPFKGWAQQIGDPDYSIDPLSYPYLAEIIGELGTPLGASLTTYQGVNNVGGASIHETAAIVYWSSTPFALDVYESETITVANGDQIFLANKGICYLDPNTFAVTGYMATGTVVGGTGRFEGAGGSVKITPHSPSVGVFQGHIVLVGKADRQ